MTISQKEISEKIEFLFKCYDENLIKEKRWQLQVAEHHRMVGAITNMLDFGIIKMDKYCELRSKACESLKNAVIV